jgi:hypothetical protein
MNLNNLLQEYNDAIFNELCAAITLVIVMLGVVMCYTMKKSEN